MRSSGANADAHHSGGFLDRQIVIEHELEHLPLSLRKLRERVTQTVAARFALDLCVRRNKRILSDASRVPRPASRLSLHTLARLEVRARCAPEWRRV